MSCNFNQHKSQDRSTFPITFFAYTCILELILIVVILPHLNSIFKYELSLSLTIAIILIYLKLYFSDPGFKTIKLNKSLLKLTLDGEILNNICPRCITYVKASTKHCYYCNKCVENFDHHCIWIKNCIGSKNFNAFFTFLILLCVKLLVNVLFSIEGIKCNNEINFLNRSCNTSR